MSAGILDLKPPPVGPGLAPEPTPTTNATARLVEMDLGREGPGAVAPGPPLSPEGVPAVMNLAVHLFEEGHLQQAEPVLLRILRAQPFHVRALHYLGVVRFEIGDPDGAIALLQHAVALAPHDAEIQRNLGEAYRTVRRLDEAETHLSRSVELDADDPDTLCNLGHLRVQQGRMAEATAEYSRALSFSPDDSPLLTFLGAAFCHQGRVEEAAKCFHRAVQIRPDNVTAAHLLAAMRNDPITEVPEEYIVDLFDTYADSFDEHLVKMLRYDAPTTLLDAVERTVGGAASDWRVIDLGCGTGLCGVAFRPWARELIGIDLSPRMVRHARRRNIYDTLMVGDLTAALTPEDGTVDLIVAGDVLLYVGALDRVFAHTARAMRPGGLLTFTTERYEGDAFEIQTSGRFAHGDAYIRRLAGAHDFEIAIADPITVRVERNLPIDGELFVLRRTTAPRG